VSGAIDGLAQALAGEGVPALFGVPGSGASYEVILALQERGVPFYGATHEGAAAIMAGALGRQSGGVGCSIGIKGPGLANMLPGIVSNHFERWPTLSIAEAVGPRTPPGRVHKRLDQAALLSSVVKAYATPDESGQTVAGLLACAQQEIPGPVHLDLAAGAAASLAVHVSREGHSAEPAVGWTDVRRLVADSARPLLIVGALARRAGWRRHLTQLRVPVLTTLSAKGIVDEHLPHSGGVFTGDGKALSPERRLLEEADLVIGLGLRNFEVLNPAAISGPLIMMDTVASAAGDGFAATACSTASDEEFEELLAGLRDRAWGAESIGEAQQRLREHLLGHPWLPAAVFATLEELVPTAVLVVDTGSFCTIAEHVWRAPDPRGFLCSANGRYMGTGVPMAIGAALADPDRPVICATGDGGVRMYVAELKLALEHRLPILFLFLSDGRYGSIAAAIPPARRRAAVLSMARPSWHDAVRALGCPAEQVDSVAALRTVVRQWRATGGPCFVEACFDPEAYVAMTEDLR
jgi:acetolactate synthase-1/2/3 large subunit